MQTKVINRKASSASTERELSFFSDKFNVLIKRSDLADFSDDKLSLLLSEALSVYASLGGVIEEINKRMEFGDEDIDFNWSRRVRTKALVVKHFIDSIKKERKDKKLTRRDRNFRLLIEMRVGRVEISKLLAQADSMTEEEWAEFTSKMPGYAN